MRPWSVCLQDCSFCQGGHLLAVLVILPFLGRLLGEKMLKGVKTWAVGTCSLCKPPNAPVPGIQDTVPTSSDTQGCGFTFSMLVRPRRRGEERPRPLTWTEARYLNNESYCGAISTGAVRFLMWHGLQPVLCEFARRDRTMFRFDGRVLTTCLCTTDGLALYCAWTDGDLKPGSLQMWLGYAVGARELLYLLSTLICMFLRPTFLLVDPMASYYDATRAGRGGVNLQSGSGFLAMYVLAPEKFVACELARLHFALS